MRVWLGVDWLAMTIQSRYPGEERAFHTTPHGRFASYVALYVLTTLMEHRNPEGSPRFLDWELLLLN
jgi:hypothetical protein